MEREGAVSRASQKTCRIGIIPELSGEKRRGGCRTVVRVFIDFPAELVTAALTVEIMHPYIVM